MKRIQLSWLLMSLTLVGCSTVSNTLDAVNPFSSSGKKGVLPVIETKTDLKRLWDISVGKSGDYTFTPSHVDRSVFTASREGTVQRIEEGRVQWKVALGYPLSAGIGADAKFLAVGTEKGDVVLLSSETGKTLWKVNLASEVLAAPTLSSDGVVVRTGDNRITLLSLEDGKRKWSYQRTTPSLSLRSTASPVVSDRYVFVGFPGGKLLALGMSNGAPLWEGTVALPKGATELDRVADIVAAPVIDGSQVCAVAFQGRVACFDLGQSGALIWARDLSSAAGLALDGRYLFVTDEKGAVHALDRLTGSSLWKQDKLSHRRVGAPIVIRGSVAVADGEGYVHLLSRDDGMFLGRIKTDGSPVRANLKTLGSALLVQTSGGELTAIEPQ